MQFGVIFVVPGANKMIKLSKKGNHLLVVYRPRQDSDWLSPKFKANETAVVKKTFHFSSAHLKSPTSTTEGMEVEEDFVFCLGELSDDYFKIDREIVQTNNTFYFHQDMALSDKCFVAETGISVLRRIDALVHEDVYIGGNRNGSMPEKAYLDLIRMFPNSYELAKYASARVEASLRDYFETVSDTQRLFDKYLNKKLGSKNGTIFPVVRQNELQKYHLLLKKLEDMLSHESQYSEHNWQTEILQIILLLFPKYIHAFREAPVRNPIDGKKKFIDILLVDFTGNIDLIEIKKPFDNCIVSQRQYRDNFIPMKELSGTVMQLEKYIYYLSRWGSKGEDTLTDKYRDKLPHGFELKIINPKGLIIMGRGISLSPDQRNDFEIVKRKYHNVIDIITYDDLLERLRFTIAQFESDQT